MDKNRLYYGDNLTVLREHIKDESVDLIYLDPPFNSRQDYNVLFKEHDETKSAAQIMAFEDTWEWNLDAEASYEEIVQRGGRVSDAMRAFRTFLGNSDMMAYLAMMAPRLIELHRVLKVTGSIYLHCDPTASHYLKILMDGVFGPQFLKNEIIWRRTTSHMGARRCGNVHDVLLYFSKSDDYLWNETFQKYDEEYVRQYYRYEDENGRRFMSGDLTGAGSGPPREFGDHGLISPPVNRHWGFDQTGIDRALKEGRIYWTRNGIPRWKFYLDESEGMPLQDVWNDVQALRSWHDERLGYPTQKPESLLERVITASSNEGDTVLDPFCGCGTAIAVAQRLNRHWIGIDITHLAIGLIKKRLDDAFGEEVRKTYEVIGEPVDLPGAQKLADEDKFQFQSWALSMVGARQAGGVKKGADRGIDGRLIFFYDDKSGRKEKQIIFSVKGGGVQVKDVRDLRGVIEREKAEIGVLITMEPPTKPMMKEAIEAGFYQPPGVSGAKIDRYPRIQILTIEDLLEGKKVEYPRNVAVDATYKKAPRARKAAEQQMSLSDADAEDEGPF